MKFVCAAPSDAYVYKEIQAYCGIFVIKFIVLLLAQQMALIVSVGGGIRKIAFFIIFESVGDN